MMAITVGQFSIFFSDLKLTDNKETKENLQEQFLQFHECLVDCINKYYPERKIFLNLKKKREKLTSDNEKIQLYQKMEN